MRRVVLDQIEIRGAIVMVRWLKQTVDDGRVIVSQPHRSALAPDSDANAQRAEIDAHLMQLGYPATADADWQAINAHRGVALGGTSQS